MTSRASMAIKAATSASSLRHSNTGSACDRRPAFAVGRLSIKKHTRAVSGGWATLVQQSWHLCRSHCRAAAEGSPARRVGLSAARPQQRFGVECRAEASWLSPIRGRLTSCSANEFHKRAEAFAPLIWTFPESSPRTHALLAMLKKGTTQRVCLELTSGQKIQTHLSDSFPSILSHCPVTGNVPTTQIKSAQPSDASLRFVGRGYQDVRRSPDRVSDATALCCGMSVAPHACRTSLTWPLEPAQIEHRTNLQLRVTDGRALVWGAAGRCTRYMLVQCRCADRTNGKVPVHRCDGTAHAVQGCW